MNKENNLPKTKSSKVLNAVVSVLLILVLLFGIFCSYTAFASKKGSGVPDIFGLRIFSIQSDSMEDEFYEGDLIIDVAVKDPSKLEVNDVITFYTIIKGERVLNTHRITKIEDKGTYLAFTTQGDNSPEEDPMQVHQNEIVGKYCFAIPKLGSVIDFLQTSVGFLLVIVLPVALFFIYSLVQFFRVFFSYRMQKMRLELEREMKEKADAESLDKQDGDKQNTDDKKDSDA